MKLHVRDVSCETHARLGRMTQLPGEIFRAVRVHELIGLRDEIEIVVLVDQVLWCISL